MTQYQKGHFKDFGTAPPATQAFAVSISSVNDNPGNADTFGGYQASLTYLIDGKHEVAARGKAMKGDKTNIQIRALDALFYVTAQELGKKCALLPNDELLDVKCAEQ